MTELTNNIRVVLIVRQYAAKVKLLIFVILVIRGRYIYRSSYGVYTYTEYTYGLCLITLHLFFARKFTINTLRVSLDPNVRGA